MSTVNWLSARVRGARVLVVGADAEPLESLIAGNETEVTRTPSLAEGEFEPGAFDTVVLEELPAKSDLGEQLTEARRLLDGTGGALVLAAPVGATDDGAGASLASTLESVNEAFAIERIEPLEGHLGVVARPRTGDADEGLPGGWAGVLEAVEHQLTILEKRYAIEHDRAERQADQLRVNRKKLARSRRKLRRAKEKADRIARKRAEVEQELEQLKRTRAVRLARRLNRFKPGSGRGTSETPRGPVEDSARAEEAELEEVPAPVAEAELGADEDEEEPEAEEATETFADVELLFSPRRAPDLPAARPDLTVACIMDDFSKLAFSPEFNYVDFGPDDWRATLEEHRPDLLLVESAWRGKDGLWKGRIPRFERHYEPDPALQAAVSWCRERDIPTVFWGKEDPPNFHRFVDQAVLFDHIFTTDEETIPRYLERCGHDRVALLPFAMQPRIHNPAGAPRPRPFGVAFAGSYWHGRYPERMGQMETVLGPALEFGLQIFSRPATDSRTGFPEPYASHVVGSLPYESILTAYHSYKVFLNVNSVPNSRSMCARRIFELLACGASVVSGASPAIERLLGPGLVRESSTKAQTQEFLELLLSDDELRDREATVALRSLLGEHTYGHRVRRILSSIGIADEQPHPTVSVIGVAESDSERDALRATIERQTYAPVEPLVVERNGATLAERLNAAMEHARGDLVAVLDPGSRYGPEYLVDLVNAFAYTDAEAVGKSAHHLAAGRRIVRVAGAEHDRTDEIDPRTLVLSRSLAERLRFDRAEFDGLGAALTVECRRLGTRPYAVDRFNFVAHGATLAPATGDHLIV
jgi:spore maturation protein CgeB